FLGRIAGDLGDGPADLEDAAVLVVEEDGDRGLRDELPEACLKPMGVLLGPAMARDVEEGGGEDGAVRFQVVREEVDEVADAVLPLALALGRLAVSQDAVSIGAEALGLDREEVAERPAPILRRRVEARGELGREALEAERLVEDHDRDGGGFEEGFEGGVLTFELLGRDPASPGGRGIAPGGSLRKIREGRHGRLGEGCGSAGLRGELGMYKEAGANARRDVYSGSL